MEQIVEKNECGCRYHDGKELADIIWSFYIDRDKLHVFSDNARKLYEREFNAEKLNEVFLCYLKELVQKGN